MVRSLKALALARTAIWSLASAAASPASPGWQLQSSSVGAPDATFQVRLLGLVRGPDNALGVNAKWTVRLNNPQLWSNAGV